MQNEFVYINLSIINSLHAWRKKMPPYNEYLHECFRYGSRAG